MTERWRFKKGDEVCILAGKDKGKTGKILKVLRESRRVLVEGINIVGRHQKPTAAYPQGGVIRKESPLHSSNVAHIDPVSKKPTRIGVMFLENGKKVRYAKHSNEIIDK